MRLLDGKAAAKKVRKSVKKSVDEFYEKNKFYPKLTVVIVGNDPASHVYVKNKIRACKKTSIISEKIQLPENVSEEKLINIVKDLNNDKTVNGILVQLPLPKHINEDKIINLIDPIKDVDCFHPVNIGKIMLGEDGFLPCTPAGILKLLEIEGIETEGKNVTILGRSHIVGLPMANLLLQKNKMGNATVTVCHSRTKDLKEHCIKADILIAAIGKKEFVKRDLVKNGAVIIDVGMHYKEIEGENHLVGDVDFDSVKDIVTAITPVPGGVGPMTIAMLMENTFKALLLQKGRE